VAQTALRPRQSAITFDAGAAGVRVLQLRRLGGRLLTVDALNLELPDDANPSDGARLARMAGQARFCARRVGLVLSPPEARFFTHRVPGKLLEQPAQRVREALAWEVARETRTEPGVLEVRWWPLPAGHHQGLNVMSAAMPRAQAEAWFDAFAARGLFLQRIDVSPCALARLARHIWTPTEKELWGLVDLGARQTHLTMVIGATPAYIRSLPISSQRFTQRIAEAFEIPLAEAEQLKRRHGIRPGARGVRSVGPGSRLQGDDVSAVLYSLLREFLDHLVHEIELCASYVARNYADLQVSRFLLAGGGANLAGLGEHLELTLGLPVWTISNASDTAAGVRAAATARRSASEARPAASRDATDPPGVTRPTDSQAGSGQPESIASDTPWERPLDSVTVTPQTAVVLGAALLDLDGTNSDCQQPAGLPAACTTNLVPEACRARFARLRRRNAWTVGVVAFGLMLVAAWAASAATGQSIERLRESARLAQARDEELVRGTTLATRQCETLLSQARALFALRSTQPVSAQILRIFQAVPSGVVLTELRGVRTSPEPAAAGTVRGQAASPRAAGSAAAPASQPEQSADGKRSEGLEYHLSGYALDPANLAALIEELRGAGDWPLIELRRASREKFLSGTATKFELTCGTEGRKP